MNIGIIGCRIRDSIDDLNTLIRYLESVEYENDITIVSGGCSKGGDRFAEIIAKNLKLPIIIHYPDKSKMNPKGNHRAEYRKVCFERNTLIARDSDILIALVAPDRKGGTEDTIKKYLAMGKKELVIL